MSGKNQKKSIGKGLSRSKTQDHSLKSKPETESSSKELSELEKELLSIKISELEENVTRKTHICNFMEEEKDFFEVELRDLKLLKVESMNHLNKAYQEFSLELQLLDHDLKRLEDGYAKTIENEKADLETAEKVQTLSLLQLRLEKKLEEAKKNAEEITLLEVKLQQLHYHINQKKECFKTKISELNYEFIDFIKRLEDKMYAVVNSTIRDKELKLDLLPVPYQALFLSGQLGSIWCKSVLESCENLLKTNLDIKKKLEEMKINSKNIYKEISNLLLSVVLSQHIRIYNSLKQDVDQTPESETKEPDNDLLQNGAYLKYIEQLKELASKLEKEIEDLLKRTADLENTIAQQEASKFEGMKNTHMMQVIMQAKDIIVKEL